MLRAYGNRKQTMHGCYMVRVMCRYWQYWYGRKYVVTSEKVQGQPGALMMYDVLLAIQLHGQNNK